MLVFDFSSQTGQNGEMKISDGIHWLVDLICINGQVDLIIVHQPIINPISLTETERNSHTCFTTFWEKRSVLSATTAMKCAQRVCGTAKVRPRKPNESQWPPRHNKSKRLPLVRNLKSLYRTDVGLPVECQQQGRSLRALETTYRLSTSRDVWFSWQVTSGEQRLYQSCSCSKMGVLKATSPVATVQVETHVVQPNFI